MSACPECVRCDCGAVIYCLSEPSNVQRDVVCERCEA